MHGHCQGRRQHWVASNPTHLDAAAAAKTIGVMLTSHSSAPRNTSDVLHRPTFPQLYIGGELIGGLDILKEMVESDTLKDVLPKEESLNDRLKALINRDPVMVFIKGTPEAPRCGFSRTIVGLLNELEGVTYGYYDILGDEQVRAGLKTYSDWPTFPQLYAKGELLGGLDIVKEMHASGELVSELV